MKKSLMVGATLATLTVGSLGTVGLAAADTSSSTSSDGVSSLVEKLASKFNLNQDEVQAVFDADRTERQAEMKADQAERLAQAVSDGDLTQAQADYITNAQAEIESLMGNTKPNELSDEVRDQIKEKMDALRDWAEENDVDMQYIGPGGHGGPRGGGPGEAASSSDE